MKNWRFWSRFARNWNRASNTLRRGPLKEQRIEKIEDRRTATDASLKQQLSQLAEAQAELGVQNKVVLATPTTLIALLKAIAYGWQQEAIACEAKQIAELGRELYERIGVLTGYFTDVGKALGKTVDNYNKAIRSVESGLLVTARKFEALDSSNADALPEANVIEKQPILPKEEDS